jgi:hypothetical protein
MLNGYEAAAALVPVASSMAVALNTTGLQPDKLCVIDENGKGFAVVLDTPDFKSQPDWVDTEG